MKGDPRYDPAWALTRAWLRGPGALFKRRIHRAWAGALPAHYPRWPAY